MKKYNLIVCGGTFDLLHKGHKKFLQDILGISNKVLLGITSNSYVSKFKNDPSARSGISGQANSGQVQIEDFDVRKSEVVSFLESIGSKDRVKIVSINQAYEPLLTSEFSPKAIAVTAQTKKTALEINQKRKKLEMPPLEIIVIEMEKAKDGGLISSSRIRNGEINRDGRLYVQKDWAGTILHLPEHLRPELSKPFGKVLSSPPLGLNGEKVITIGDISTQRFNQKNVGQFLSIVDFKVHRQKKFDKLSQLGFGEIETITVTNEHGTISPQLFEAVQKAIQTNGRKVILVKGEEDLAVIPALLIAPLGFMVYYGQPNQGLVEVPVTEENKEKVFDLVNKFIMQS